MEGDLADHEVACESRRNLHKDDLQSVGLAPVKQGGQAGTVVLIRRAAHARCAELVDLK